MLRSLAYAINACSSRIAQGAFGRSFYDGRGLFFTRATSEDAKISSRRS